MRKAKELRKSKGYGKYFYKVLEDGYLFLGVTNKNL